jgi:uncharacterized glyoxalase superfamily protein PhnB
MANEAKKGKTTVIPGLRYRNALEMIAWLQRAFGFEKHAVYAGQDGTVMHAELTLGDGMIMLGSVNNGTPSSALIKQPDEVGGAETQSSYLIVADCDSTYAAAKAAGAHMLMDLEEKDYGGKGFTCRDPEGHIWSVGTYDPWQAKGESKQ